MARSSSYTLWTCCRSDVTLGSAGPLQEESHLLQPSWGESPKDVRYHTLPVVGVTSEQHSRSIIKQDPWLVPWGHLWTHVSLCRGHSLRRQQTAEALAALCPCSLTWPVCTHGSKPHPFTGKWSQGGVGWGGGRPQVLSQRTE